MGRYKNIIKKGMKDLSWLESFLKEKLNGEAEISINAGEKMYNNIFCKYGRIIEIEKGGKYQNKVIRRVIFTNGKYAFEQSSEAKNGKYGIYFVFRIIDIEKYLENQEEKEYKDYLKKNKKDSEELKILYKELCHITFSLNGYYFKNIISDKKLLNNNIDNTEIINKIELLEG